MDPFKSGGLETVTQLYLTGRGERSYFDARAMYFYGLSASDVQSQIPLIHPVIDYRNKLAQPLFGGELTLPRQPHQPVARQCRLRSDHPDGVQHRPVRPADRRSGAQDAGQLHPARHSRHLFARLRRSDLAAHADRSVRAEVDAVRLDRARRHRGAVGQDRRPASPTILPTGDSTVGRFMPAVGLEYRYPFISVQLMGHADDRADRAARSCGRTRRKSASCRTKTRKA